MAGINTLSGGGFRPFQGGRFAALADMTAPPVTTAATTPAPAGGAPTPTPTPGTGSNLPGGIGGAFGGIADKVKDVPVIGDIFSRLGKNQADTVAEAGGTPYQRLDQPGRTALLNTMLQRARGGQPGGAPNTPLPAPGANVPTA